jgi:hypothetical protein
LGQPDDRPPWSRWWRAWRPGIGVAVGVLVVTACGAGSSGRPAPSATPPSSATASPTTAGSAPANPTTAGPAVVATGAYLGAWVNPVKNQGRTSEAGSAELAQLPEFRAAIGGDVSILHVYSGWAKPAPVASLAAVAAAGAIPLLDWSCGPSDQSIAAGGADSVITTYARALADYGRPVFLRWFWEMDLQSANQSSGCVGSAGASGYVAAWQHIWTIFHQLGVKNVSFVWCPGVEARTADLSGFYPGDQYVDWIGVDGYDRAHLGEAGFASVFGRFYAQWVTHRKPIMVAETGATSVDQASYLTGMARDLPIQFPEMKAVVYFDAVGPHGDWVLQGTGLSTFRQLASSPYFTVAPAPPQGATP